MKSLSKINLAGKTSIIVIILFIAIAVFAPYLANNDPMETDPSRSLSRPDGFIFGTDQLGQCIYSRIVYGARLSLIIALSARISSLIIGLFAGLTAGYFGGYTDWLIMRLVDMFLAFPSLLLAIAISMAMGSGITTVILALSITGWAEMARIIRSATLELKNNEYVLASRTLGASHLRVIITHILPNCLPLVTVIFAMGMATAILAEASLSFLGLGVDPSLPTWGGMVASGRTRMISHPGLVIYPGLCIALLVISFNIFGDELRDYFDPGRRGGWF